MSVSQSRKPSGKPPLVSLWPSKAVDDAEPDTKTSPQQRRKTHAADDLLAKLRDYDISGGERVNYSVPDVLKLLLEVASAKASPDSETWNPRGRGKRRKPLNSTAVFCIVRGLPRLYGVPGIAAIMDARHAASKAGASELAWHKFTYDFDTKTAPLQLRLLPDTEHEINTMAAALGLRRDTVVSAALALVLIDLPLSPADRRELSALLDSFASRIRDRAREVLQRQQSRHVTRHGRRWNSYREALAQWTADGRDRR